jgi:hypothetical protein
MDMAKFLPNFPATPITFEFITDYAAGRPPSLRILRRDPRTGWTIFPVSKALAAYQGKLALPMLAGQTVDIALAYVELMNRKPIRLARLARDEWQFDSNGEINEQAISNRILDKINGPSTNRGRADGRDVFCADDINSIRLVLGLPYEA